MHNLIREQCSTFHAWSMYVVMLFIAAWFGQQFAIMFYFTTFLKRIKLIINLVLLEYTIDINWNIMVQPSAGHHFLVASSDQGGVHDPLASYMTVYHDPVTCRIKICKTLLYGRCFPSQMAESITYIANNVFRSNFGVMKTITMIR